MNIIYSNLEKNNEYSVIGLLSAPLEQTLALEYWIWLESMKDFVGGTTEFGEIPRTQKFYDEKQRYFNQKWKNQSMKRWMAHAYDAPLIKLQTEMQNKIDVLDIYTKYGVKKQRLNSCLINKYEHGKHSIKPHRDTEDTFGSNPTVVGLSLGDERTIKFKRIIYDPTNMRSIKIDEDNPLEIDVKLPSGSILIMAGAVQKYFSHEIPKCEKKTTRYSLTFREYV